MAKTEFENLAVLLYFAFKSIATGKIDNFPVYIKALLYRLVESAHDLYGAKKVECPFCGWQGSRFRTFVPGPPYIRHNALCPRCLSLERHREFLKLFKKIRQLMPGSIKLLDIAPNYAFSEYCKNNPEIDYLSIDLSLKLAMRHMDIQYMDLEDKIFDIVICFHVLDYVPDDKKALQEIYRVLKPEGIGILQEGIDLHSKTIQWGYPKKEELNRIRRYGYDFLDLIRSVGFSLKQVKTNSGIIFLVTKNQCEFDVSQIEI